MLLCMEVGPSLFLHGVENLAPIESPSTSFIDEGRTAMSLGILSANPFAQMGKLSPGGCFAQAHKHPQGGNSQAFLLPFEMLTVFWAKPGRLEEIMREPHYQ